MKKSNFGKKLVLNQETVRSLSQEELEGTQGGTLLYNNYTIAGQSVGGTYPAPTKDTEIGGYVYYYGY